MKKIKQMLTIYFLSKYIKKGIITKEEITKLMMNNKRKDGG